MRVAITGANGFIGNALYQALTESGHQVSRWVRNPTLPTDRHFCMPDNIAETLFTQDKPDLIIHAAYVTQPRSAIQSWKANMEGSKRLFALAEANNVKILFLSSLSAHSAALSVYGRSKYQLEASLDLTKQLVIKPGLVIGPGGLFLRMIQMLRRFKFAPVFWGGNQPIYGVAIQDLVTACQHLIENQAVGRYHVMETEPKTIRNFYSTLMQALHLKPRMLSLPGELSLFLVTLLEKFSIVLPINAENLLGLKQAQYFTSDCVTIGIKPIDMRTAIEKAITHV